MSISTPTQRPSSVMVAANNAAPQRPDQRMARKYRFDDPDMDLFFMSAMSWGPSGGLDIGQAYYVASQIVDGDADSWVGAFADYGDRQNEQADAWIRRGWKRAAGEAHLKAFAAYRSAWQFAEAGGPVFADLYGRQRAAFASAMAGLDMPVTFFEVPFEGASLPGLFLRHADPDAPVALVIGGADTCHEDLFLSVGRAVWERGYSVAIVDLPGQGNTAAEGMHWQTEPERSISAAIDVLVERFGARPGSIALIGLSLGGYFVTRAAGAEPRLATVIATTPFPEPGELFALSVQAARHGIARGQIPSTAAQRSRRMIAWKAGVDTPEALLARWHGIKADPAVVTVPFLSIVGGGDSTVFATQARAWHEAIASARKDFVFLDASTGADGHCQVNARLRFVQEACGWMDDILRNRSSMA
jgi:pimeloyl-ACP methyl ester carboxylesterase